MLKYFLVMLSLDCACWSLCFAFLSVMFFFRCSFRASTFFSAFSRSSLRFIFSSSRYVFSFLPKIFVVGMPYWSRRMNPIWDGECFAERSRIVFLSSGSFILTHVGLDNCSMLVGVNLGF